MKIVEADILPCGPVDFFVFTITYDKTKIFLSFKRHKHQSKRTVEKIYLNCNNQILIVIRGGVIVKRLRD